MTVLFNHDFRSGQGPWRTRHVPNANSSDSCAIYGQEDVTLKIRKRADGEITTGHIYVPPEVFQFTHGYAEARMRFMHPAGAHSAFWLQTTEDYIVGQSEVDVVECFAHKNRLNHAVHWREPGQLAEQFTSWSISTNVVVTPVGWHDYGVEWTESGYVFTIDGKDVGECTEGLSDRPKMLVLSILSDVWERQRYGFVENTWAYRSKCKWVKVRSKR